MIIFIIRKRAHLPHGVSGHSLSADKLPGFSSPWCALLSVFWLIQAGASRIVTDRVDEIYAQWLKSAEEETREIFEQKEQEDEKEENTVSSPMQSNQTDTPDEPSVSPLCAPTGNPETDYCCRLVGNSLEFL